MNRLEALEMAAKMTGGEGATAFLLHYKLTNRINEIERLCQVAGGQLRSRQIVAVIVAQWKHDNPNERPYCFGD